MTHVLYFTADWCNPCQRTKPIAEELASECIIDFKFIDVDIETQLAQSFNIMSIPTFILIKDKKEVKRMFGAKTREEFLTFIK